MQSGEDNDPFQYQCNWPQPEMGEIGQVSYMQDIYSVTGAYPVNCAATTPTVDDNCRVIQSEENRNYTLLTATSQPSHSPQTEYITHDSYVKQESYSYYPASPSGPYLEIMEQPFNRHRFRYQSERGSHGGMAGATSTETRKTYPTVRLVNYTGDPSQVQVRASLCTDSDDPEPHVHKLQGKTCRSPFGDCIMQLNNDMTCVLQQVSIIFTAKKQVADILYQRKREQINSLQEADEKALKLEADNETKKLNMNAVRIRFEAITHDGQVIHTVLSNPIYNQRELKITRISRYSGSCRGDDEVFMFCEKVNKKEIKIRFFECDEARNRIWEAFGTFTDSDVHHQVAIAFKTPSYHTLDICEPVKVRFELYRARDHECSESVEFTYRPERRDEELLARKRQKRDHQGGDDDGQYRPHPNQDSFYPPSSSFHDNSGSSSGQMYSTMYNGGQGTFGGFTYTAPSTESSNESSNSSFQSASMNPTSSSPSIVPTDASNESSNSSSQGAAFNPLDSSSFGLIRYPHQSSTTESSSDSNDSSSLDNILNTSVAPSFLVTPSLGDPLDLNAFQDMYMSDGSRNRDSATRRVSTNIDGLEMAVAQMNISRTIDNKPADCNLDVPSVRQRSSSLVEEKDAKAIADSNTLKIFLNRLSQATRQYAITADPKALTIPLRSLMAKQDKNGDNTLHLAIIHQSSNEAFLQQLLSVMPAEFLNYTNNLFQTPLHLAVILDKPSIVQLLLMKGAHPGIQDKDGNTAVHLAVLKKRYMCLAVLLNKQTYGSRRVTFDFADILNYNGYAAIHLAVKADDENCITKLADAGANINIGDGTSGKSALHLAVEQKSLIINCLLRQIKIDVDCQDFTGDTPLHLACIQGSEEIVLELMEADANPLIENHLLPEGAQESEIPRGVTPYDIAAETNNGMIKSILAGEVPTDLRRRISLSRKTSLQETYTHDCTNEFESKPALSQSNLQNSQKLHATSMIDSGYTSGPQFNEIPEALIEKLCQLLDPPNKGWQDLVRTLIDPERVKNFEILHESSPTLGVLEHLKKQGELTIETLKNLFEASNLPSAQALFEN